MVQYRNIHLCMGIQVCVIKGPCQPEVAQIVKQQSNVFHDRYSVCRCVDLNSQRTKDNDVLDKMHVSGKETGLVLCYAVCVRVL